MSSDTDDPQQRFEKGLRLLHRMRVDTRNELSEVAHYLITLIEELNDNGVIDQKKLFMRNQSIRAEKRTLPGVRDRLEIKLSPPEDKYALTNLPDIDCASLMRLCHGRCCGLRFPLNEQDLDEGVVKWDYFRPYLIRYDETKGRCCHQTEALSCDVYHQRPAICRRYDCRRDKRIWLDFENQIPAPMQRK